MHYVSIMCNIGSTTFPHAPPSQIIPIPLPTSLINNIYRINSNHPIILILQIIRYPRVSKKTVPKTQWRHREYLPPIILGIEIYPVLSQNLFWNNFVEITLWQGCCPINCRTFSVFRTPFYKNTYGVLLLYPTPVSRK